MKRTFRIDEVAEQWDVSRRTVERLIKKGELESIKVGDTRRITVDEIERFEKKKPAEQSNP